MALRKCIIFTPTLEFSSEAIGRLINSELFYISRPSSIRDINDVSNGIFELVVNHNDGRCAMLYDEDYEITVHPQNDLTTLSALLVDVNNTDKIDLTSYIKASSKIKFKDIIPSSIIIYGEEDLTLMGWFSEPTISSPKNTIKPI